MNAGWLAPLRRALDAAPRPVTFFFRDDDAGWRDDRLEELLDLFALHDLPIDVAMIPAALRPTLAEQLTACARGGRVGLHQHGTTHENHEPTGRRHEFGCSRDAATQLADIERGRALLQDALGRAVDPIFTPPWNRCTRATAACLVELGFIALSRESRAGRFGLEGLRELPVDVDWQSRAGVECDLDLLASALASAASGRRRVGVMLHHAVLDDAHRRALSDLLQLVSRHERAIPMLMRDVLQIPSSAASHNGRPEDDRCETPHAGASR